jgi:hypothetical protein
MFAKQPRIHAAAGGQEASGELILVGNGRLYGGRFELFPGAEVDDGLLDATVFPRVTWFALFRCGISLLACGRLPANAARRVNHPACERGAMPFDWSNSRATTRQFRRKAKTAGGLPWNGCRASRLPAWCAPGSFRRRSGRKIRRVFTGCQPIDFTRQQKRAYAVSLVAFSSNFSDRPDGLHMGKFSIGIRTGDSRSIPTLQAEPPGEQVRLRRPARVKAGRWFLERIFLGRQVERRGRRVAAMRLCRPFPELPDTVARGCFSAGIAAPRNTHSSHCRGSKIFVRPRCVNTAARK